MDQLFATLGMIIILLSIVVFFWATSNWHAERKNNEYWIMVSLAKNEVNEEERDYHLKKFSNWSERHWRRFKKHMVDTHI